MLLLSLKGWDRLQTRVSRCWTERKTGDKQEKGFSRSSEASASSCATFITATQNVINLCGATNGLMSWVMMMDEQKGDTHTRWFCCFSDGMPCDSDCSTGSVFRHHLVAPYSSLIIIKLIWLRPYHCVPATLQPQTRDWLAINWLVHWWTPLLLLTVHRTLHQHSGGLFDPLYFWPCTDLSN